MAHTKAIDHHPHENHCVIIGAGIAGLTAALSLERFGFSVLILEKAERLEEVGAGLQLSPNASSILKKLGVLETLLPRATILTSIDLMSAHNGKQLLSLKTNPLATSGAPFLAVLRSDLQAALLHHVKKSPAIELRLGATSVQQTTRDDVVEITYQYRGKPQSVSALCLVGADGVWSALRQLANGARAHYSGYMAQRQTLEQADLDSTQLTDDHSVKAFLSSRAHLVAYPIAQGRQINLVYITKQRRSDIVPPAPIFDQFDQPLAKTLSAHSHWTNWPLHTLDARTTWRLDNRTILIGDAAHAILPFAAQGAAMAIEDAHTLAYCLNQNRTNVPSALAAYEDHRRKRIGRVTTRGKLNALAYHASGPIALARNLVFAAKGQRLMADLDWLYGYRVPGLN